MTLSSRVWKHEDRGHRPLVDERLAHRTAIERLAHAGAVPNTSLALVTELFRDWKSPVADRARGIIKPYLAEVQKLAAPLRRST